ncbi:ribonuclease H-like domain-containing protein [Mycena alexandri]|uniref:Ribonuclease H-like domain-containing protein n=1 Tax=Mycena alexandri TaxID=1745969 RepID=A0AAD6WK23_9AGAR|nr:ribonuclease H-like domain-containing protein [Mycena alexandri]
MAHRAEELKEQDEKDVQAGVREYPRDAEELADQVELDVKAISGKAETMLSHLSGCEHADPAAKATALAGSKKENRVGRNVRLSRTQTLARHAVLQHGPPLNVNLQSAPVDAMTLNIPRATFTDPIPGSSSQMMWDPSKQQEFAEDLCKLFIACNVAWNSANNPELHLFFTKYLPGAKIPDRRVLSGRVLDTLVGQVENEMKAKVSGKLGMGQCDGWKSGAKASIITSSVTVEAEAAHDVSPEKKSADNLLEIVLADIEYCETEFGISFIGYFKIPRLLVPPCWGHQVNLIVVEVLRLKIPCMEAIDEGTDLAKWFINHSRALGLLKDHQKLTERFKITHRILTLIFPVISRWIYHFLAVRRILTLSTSVRGLYHQDPETLIACAGAKRDATERARAVLQPIENPQFWKNLAEVKIILEPLAIAAKCMQRPDAGIDQVLLMLGNLYRIYGTSTMAPRVRNCVQNSLEKRWRAMERPAFILALFLNPYIRATAFSKTNPAVKPIALYNIAKELFTRFFDIEPDLDFHAAFFDYSKDSKEFSANYMGLAMMKEMYERENQHVNVVRVWERLDTGAKNGRNGLTRLAIWLLSVVANSAGSERGFSKFGIILSKLRTQLSIQKVRKMSTVDSSLKRKHEELGMKTDRIKRRFVRFAEQFTPSQSANMDYEATDSFAGLSTQLVRDAETDGLLGGEDNEEEEEEDDDEPGRVHSATLYNLKALFQYPDDESGTLANGLGFYWQGGLKDLHEELELYDLLMEEDDA